MSNPELKTATKVQTIITKNLGPKETSDTFLYALYAEMDART